MPLDFIDHQLERLPQLVSLSGNAAMSVSVMTALLDLRPVPPPVEVPALETFSRPCQLRKLRFPWPIAAECCTQLALFSTYNSASLLAVVGHRLLTQIVFSIKMQRLNLELLVKVLERVKQSERLSCCALVNKEWQQATKKATGELVHTIFIGSTKPRSKEKELFEGLSAWLDSNQSVLTDLTLHFWRTCAARNIVGVQLPFWSLKRLSTLRLSMGSCIVAATPAGATARTLTAAKMVSAKVKAAGLEFLVSLTALTRLELFEAQLDLGYISSCPRLQHLDLRDVLHTPVAQLSSAVLAVETPWFGAGSDAVAKLQIATHGLLDVALPQLAQLTYLHYSCRLPRGTVRDGMAGLSNLQCLRTLRLGGAVQKDLIHIPTNLTGMYITLFDRGQLALNISTTPQLLQMKQLKGLGIYFSRTCHISSELLSSLNQLTYLDLAYSILDTSKAVDELLSSLQELTNLKSLCLRGSLEASPTRLDSYAGLTASNQLTFLDVRCTLSAVAAYHMFPSACPPKEVKVLVADAGLFQAADSFSRMSASCPGLEQLKVSNKELGKGLVELEGIPALCCLTALTKIRFYNIDMPENGWSSIAACTGLRHLVLDASRVLPSQSGAAGTRPFTQLTGLTRLYVKMSQEPTDLGPLWNRKDPKTKASELDLTV